MDNRKLAIFDLDGTLFDTSEVNFFAYRDALATFHVDLNRDFFVSKCNGRHYTEFLPIIMGSSKHMEEVHKLKKDTYVENLDKARVNHHLFEMINLMSQNYHIAIVTTASEKNTKDILHYFGYDELFEFMVSQEDITKVKPDPQGFLIAMDHFGATPEQTVIFEDSDVGIQAARATGASVMVVNQF